MRITINGIRTLPEVPFTTERGYFFAAIGGRLNYEQLLALLDYTTKPTHTTSKKETIPLVWGRNPSEKIANLALGVSLAAAQPKVEVTKIPSQAVLI